MNQTTKLQNSQLNDMTPEDLLMLTEDQIQLVSERVLLPDGFYHFTLTEQAIGEVGKEKQKAIKAGLVITQLAQLTNTADQAIIDAVDLSTNPVELEVAFNLQSKDGYGLRDYMTFTSEAAARAGAPTAADRIEKLNGFSGILHLTVNTYLPQGKPDSPENYVSNNRIKSTDVVWN